MGKEIKHPATIDKAGLREGAKHYGKQNATGCVIGEVTYEPGELKLLHYSGTVGTDHVITGHYVFEARNAKEKQLPLCDVRSLPGWELKVSSASKPKPTKANTRKAVTPNVIHP